MKTLLVADGSKSTTERTEPKPSRFLGDLGGLGGES